MGKDIEELLTRYSEGKLSAEEAEELYRRVTTSDTDAEAFRNWRETETLGRALRQLELMDEDKAWERLQRRLERRPRKSLRWLPLAAGLALLLGVATWLLWKPTTGTGLLEEDALVRLFPDRTDTVAVLTLADGREIGLDPRTALPTGDDEVFCPVGSEPGVIDYSSAPPTPEDGEARLHSIRVPQGGSYTVVLADGTRVHLNAGSRMSYPVSFHGTRQVTLEGEAFFEVRHGRTPFEVVTPKCRLRVLGTVFNVTAYRGEPAVTMLVSGSVEVSTTRQRVRLQPGEQARTEPADGRLEVCRVNPELYTSWVRGVFRFKDTRLEDITRLLTRWYGVDVRCATPQVGDIRLAGSVYRNRELGYTFELLQRVAGVTFERQTDGSILVRESAD